ncbi:MAG: ester cyclase [Verrucomicrobiales bacterium]|jgi:predicted ester cyclase|nr:ester cyclase [Verrucomicrobiales bacterium]
MELSDIYRNYITCLNQQDWSKLELYVDNDVCYNNMQIGLSGYRKMLESNFYNIPDLHFNIQLLIADSTYIASRLSFDCSPKGRFLDLNINGKKISFSENVFYEFQKEKIIKVWSIIDKVAIESQL